MRLTVVVLSIIMTALPAQAASSLKFCPDPAKPTSDARFEPGQVWTCTTRAIESESTVTVLAVESSVKRRTIIHVRVDGLHVRNPPSERVPSVEHLPFTRYAMLMSVDRLVKSDQPLPTFEGLDRLRVDCRGVYTRSIRDAVDVLEKTFNAGR